MPRRDRRDSSISTAALQYLGRIDDRYISVGRTRPAPTTHDLEAAIEAMLAHRLIPTPRTAAVGCLIADLRDHSRRSRRKE